MADIPSGILEAETQIINSLSKAAKDLVREFLENVEYSTITELRIKLLEFLEPLLESATDIAAAYAAETYNEIRMRAVGEAFGAEAYSGRNSEATEKAVRALLEKVVQGEYEQFVNLIMDRIDYEIKKAAAESIFHNGRIDPNEVRYARVPTGSETCSFCLMLASRGFVYHSEQSAGALDHWHPNCDCRIVQGYADMHLDGYDPDALLEQWRNLVQKKKDPFTTENGAKPQEKEKEVARWLSNLGFDVKFRRTRSKEGKKTSDIFLDGEPWEIKQPTGSGKWNISNQFNEARGQSNKLILDISRSPFDIEYIEKEVRWQLDNRTDFDEVILIKENYYKKIIR